MAYLDFLIQEEYIQTILKREPGIQAMVPGYGLISIINFLSHPAMVSRKKANTLPLQAGLPFNLAIKKGLGGYAAPRPFFYNPATFFISSGLTAMPVGSHYMH